MKGRTIMWDITVLLLVGSLRAGSVNRQIAEVASENAPDGISVVVYHRSRRHPVLQRGHRRRRRTGRRAEPARRGCRRRRCAGCHSRIQRQHSCGPEERDRLVVAAVRQGAVKGKPLAVVGASVGRYGGVWAHDETRKSFGGAGARVVEDDQIVGPDQLAGRQAPARERRAVADAVGEAVKKLAAEVG